MQLHHALEPSQQILLSFLVVVAELKHKHKSDVTPSIKIKNKQQPNEPGESQPAPTDLPPQTYTQKVAFILLDLFPDALVEEQLTQDEGAHGLDVQALRLSQDLLVGTVDGSVLLPLLQVRTFL